MYGNQEYKTFYNSIMRIMRHETQLRKYGKEQFSKKER